MRPPWHDSAARLGVIVGAGGQGRVVAAIWRRMDPERRLVFLDDSEHLWGTALGGTPVAGPIRLALDFPPPDFVKFSVGIGSNPARRRLAERLRSVGASLENVIDPSAILITQLEGDLSGLFIGPLVVVHENARLASDVLLNTQSIVEHDSTIMTAASLGPGVTVAGKVSVEEGAFLGVGATVNPRLRIGSFSIIGAGAVVVRHIPERVVAYGNPARVIRPVQDDDWGRI